MNKRSKSWLVAEKNPNKYELGEILIDKYNSDVFYKIIDIAPELDFEDKQSYFIEVLDKGNKYYDSYDHYSLEKIADRLGGKELEIEFVD